jgi:hypothetical protein
MMLKCKLDIHKSCRIIHLSWTRCLLVWCSAVVIKFISVQGRRPAACMPQWYIFNPESQRFKPNLEISRVLEWIYAPVDWLRAIIAKCINSTSPGCRNEVDQRPGPCSRRVFDFVNNRLFWLVLKFLEHNQRIANWTGFLKEKQRLKTTSTGSSYLLKTSKNWQFPWTNWY